jgi:hypothetical protein
MARGTVTTDEIAMVRAALVRLRGLKPFRGQPALVRDVEEHLAGMMAAQGARQAEPGWLPDASGAESRGVPPSGEGA